MILQTGVGPEAFIATMDIEEINTDRDKFLAAVSSNVETELKKIGLRLINVNVTDISDESGYIAALGKEAAAKAINDAKKSVAEQERDGSIGEANAHMDQRIKVSEADSIAIQGENEAKMKIAMSDAALKEKEAEALKIATTAEKIQAAKALEESYAAERAAEEARRSKELRKLVHKLPYRFDKNFHILKHSPKRAHVAVFAHLFFIDFVCFRIAVVDCSHNQVFQHFHVGGIKDRKSVV